MEIDSVESFAVRIPLDAPVSFATKTVEARTHAITRIRTVSGIEGIGYSMGYEGVSLITDTVTDILSPMLVGADPRDTERLWRTMFDGTVQIGRKGAVLRAISTVDMALWDIVAKAADQPLHKLLGAYADAVPAYASGGYYREEKGTAGLRAEMDRYVEAGHDAVKMKVGRLDRAEEVERVRAVRETIGPDRDLLMDANGAWSSAPAAVDACRAFAEFDPYFIEEPVMPDSVELMATVNDAIRYPVAAGELEFSRYGFVQLLEAGAVDIIQPDVTVVGGVTEWLKVANLAACYDVPVAPHYNWNIHAPLVAAIENGHWIEYFYRDTDIVPFDDIVRSPVTPENGRIQVPDRPGHGVELDDDRLEAYRM